MAEDAPYDERDERTGKLTPKYEDKDFINAVKDEKMATTEEIAERVGCHENTARIRLEGLEQEDEVVSKMLGGNYVWMLPE